MTKFLACGFVILPVVALLAGCGKTPPTQAGGKPVSHWVNELKSPDAKARKQAVSKLGNVGTTDPAALPAIMRALDDPDATVRGEAILAVMKFGPAATEFIPKLTQLRKDDPNAQVREKAGKAVEKLKP